MIFNKNLIQELNDNQKKLIKYLENNSKGILNVSIGEVAKANYVSPSFITKTLKKLGFYGWKDYRAFVLAKLIIPNSNTNYMNYLKLNLFNSIESSISNIDELKVVEIANKIRNCQGIVYFVGEGFSHFISLDQARRYKKSGIRAIAISSSDYEYETFKKEDIVILISASGYTESIHKNIDHLNDTNIFYYLITMNPIVANNIKNSISGVMRDTESFNEREFPKDSKFIIHVLLDWIFIKFNKNN